MESSPNKRTPSNMDEEFSQARRPVFVRVNLDTIVNNLRILKGIIDKHTEIIAVVKANAYGHGSVPVSRYLQKHGISTFAVATAMEGEELRSAGIRGNIQVFGNACEEEIPTLYDNRLTPTVGDVTFLSSWQHHCHAQPRRTLSVENDVHNSVAPVVIKVDTGMSRNGCQPEQLPAIVQFCQNNKVPIHSIMTHFAQSWDDPEFTKQQMDTFLQAVKPYRSAGIKVHVSNSGAIVNGVGTDLDFVRPGISMYGQPPDTSQFGTERTRELGLLPALSWYGKATKVADLEPGTRVGYDKTYRCSERETIATIPVGYADGFLRNLGSATVTTMDGIPCPVVGRVSMDAITVRLPEPAKHSRHFCLMANDFNDTNSCLAISRQQGTISYEVCTNLSRRIPRVYWVGEQIQTVV